MVRRTLLIAVLAALAVPAGAGAAWPGGNGRVAWFEADSGGVSPFGIRVDGEDDVVGPFCQEGLPGPCGHNPAWSPNGERLAYDLSDGRLMTSRPRGNAQRSLSFPGLIARRPAYSPTGGQLVFEGVAGGKSQLYVVDADGTGLRRLTGRGGGQPSWSTTNRIAFRRSRNLYVMNADGSGVRRVTSRGAATPDWSPHASQIVFTRGGNLYRVRPSARGLRRLSRKGGIAEPAWRPDGLRILYQRFNGNSIIYSARVDGTVQKTERTGGEGRAGFRVYQPSVEPLD
jgi:Tol biopolymer transport system component